MWVFQGVCAGDRNPPELSQKSGWDRLTPVKKSRHGPASGAHGLHGKEVPIKESQTAGADCRYGLGKGPFGKLSAPGLVYLQDESYVSGPFYEDSVNQSELRA